MTYPNNPYLFGFPTKVVGISFPGKPRIITVEVQGITPNTGNYAFNGEPFSFFANPPVGPANKVNGIALVPGVTGPLGLPTFVQPPPAPNIVNPFSDDMKKRLYAWEQPVPGFVSSNGTVGAAVLFLEVDNAVNAFNNPNTFQFEIQTTSHGTSTPPGPPEFIYYLYLTGEGQSFPGPAISATGNPATQTFMDLSGLLPHNVDPTSPEQVSEYGAEVGGFCDMYFGGPSVYIAYQATFGVPFTPAPSSAAIAVQEIENLITLGFSEPGYMNYFQWAIAPPPPPGSAACSWTIGIKSWRRANNFVVNPDGTLGVVSIVPAKGPPIIAKPVRQTMLDSHGSNSQACVNLITVTPGAMTFTTEQNFS